MVMLLMKLKKSWKRESENNYKSKSIETQNEGRENEGEMRRIMKRERKKRKSIEWLEEKYKVD